MGWTDFNMDKGKEGSEKDNVPSVRTCPIAQISHISDIGDSHLAVRSRKQASCRGVGSPMPIEQLLSQRHTAAMQAGPSRCSSLIIELF